MSQIIEAQIQITDERKRLSELQLLLKLGVESGISRRAETTLALRGTEMAFMWLGKAKGALGITNPYPESTNVANKIIEPAQDVVTELSAEVKEIISGPKKAKDLEIIFVKLGRKLLEELCRAINNDLSIMADNLKYQRCVVNAWSHAEEAKMRLGQVLGLIREGVKPFEAPGKPAAPAKEKKKDEKPADGKPADAAPAKEKAPKPAKEKKGGKAAKAEEKEKGASAAGPGTETVKAPANGDSNNEGK